MAETEQCGIETRKDGTKICSLHKQPLQETTVLEQVPEGKPYPNPSHRPQDEPHGEALLLPQT